MKAEGPKLGAVRAIRGCADRLLLQARVCDVESIYTGSAAEQSGTLPRCKVLRHLFEHAIALRMRTNNPVTDVRKLNEYDSRRIHTWSEEEIARGNERAGHGHRGCSARCRRVLLIKQIRLAYAAEIRTLFALPSVHIIAVRRGPV